MASYRIAAVIRRSSVDEFLLVRQDSPAALEDEEYRRYVDSDLWDLPSTPLKPLKRDRRTKVILEGGDYLHDKLDIRMFDVESALGQIASQLESPTEQVCESWSVLKYIEEAEFGPDSPVNTLFIIGKLAHGDGIFSDHYKWIPKDRVAIMHLESRSSGSRVGSLAIVGLLHGSDQPRNWQLRQILPNQEYPLGIVVVPMKSRTQKPFKTTNLVVIVADDEPSELDTSDIFRYGSALLVDPGCSVECHFELEDLVTALPKDLLIFLTHHHYDHVDGLSVINKCNPDAILLAHGNTLKRIDKGIWSHECLAISGGEKILIGNKKLEVVFAPGHTDGHIALLHLNTNALIVGDHCVGHGSALLDVASGGNMKDYFQTTYKFLELSPSVLIPMHGRINLWPQRMLCGYLKNRRDRELEILKAIERGAKTVYDIVAEVYANVDIDLWLAASSNVRLHVDHLACQDMLQKDFSFEVFNRSFDSFSREISSSLAEKNKSMLKVELR